MNRHMAKRAARKTGTAALAAVLLAAAALAGCREPAPSRESVSAAAEAEALPRRTFGIIYPMADVYYEAVTESAARAAETASARLIIKAPDEANLEQQIRMMETMIKQGVDGIAISPIDSEALGPLIDKAAEAGIPVICFESDAPDSRRVSYIGTDNIQAGERMGRAIDGLLKGRGMVLVSTGQSDSMNLRERLEGFLGYIHRETNIDVLEVRYHQGVPEQALADLEGMIDDHPHFDAFVALDFVSGAASILVWKAMGLNRYALTFGLMPEIAEAVRNGQITMAVSLNEHRWGALIVEHLLKACEGEEIPEFLDTGISLVDIHAIESGEGMVETEPSD
ncbi:substrate-binding domain-containing protein [Thermobacillus sp.]|uniref:sugar ABC transporter substrate-binding protein n=1 Tax=Thermobacillus sp. TaxID=2108467 RepID=UPI00257A8FD5|nr:substrate-binding domain-containing protein [Thermobacillus sp.]